MCRSYIFIKLFKFIIEKSLTGDQNKGKCFFMNYVVQQPIKREKSSAVSQRISLERKHDLVHMIPSEYSNFCTLHSWLNLFGRIVYKIKSCCKL